VIKTTISQTITGAQHKIEIWGEEENKEIPKLKLFPDPNKTMINITNELNDMYKELKRNLRTN
jgi:hypothetical protein